VTLTFDLLDLKFAPQVTRIQGHVFIKLEVSTALLFEKIGGTGRTDAGATLNGRLF